MKTELSYTVTGATAKVFRRAIGDWIVQINSPEFVMPIVLGPCSSVLQALREAKSTALIQQARYWQQRGAVGWIDMSNLLDEEMEGLK